MSSNLGTSTSSERPRYKKLKDVCKKAIEVTLKDFNNTKNEEDVELINKIKNKLQDVIDEKIKEYQLEDLLNKIDDDIQNKRQSYKKITNKKYIKEIFESYIVDDKEYFIEKGKSIEAQCKIDIENLKLEIENMEKKISSLSEENSKFEFDHNKLLNFKF